ncbi:MAG: molecular chaperone TorD family protein, partial [Candidatus Latescibacteria bacterium]|nr:molecular chaperone TorD family protein [Candidatus Latescibacterota bacterium]
EAMQTFYHFIIENRLEEIEESFTRLFDMNPSCCLEIGWHLYGEDYQRGMFLVNMRQSLAEEQLEETVELPDHLSHCLRLFTRLEPEDAEIFSQKYLQPAIAKIRTALEAENPYTCVIDLIQYILEEQYGTVELEEEEVESKLIELPVLNNAPIHYDNLEDQVDRSKKLY